MTHDTIAAIATAVGEGSIAIIRISGPDAIERAADIFRTKGDFRLADTHTVHYGHVVDPQTGQRVEEVLVTVMRGPRSFTGEDVVEIGTHGGVIAAKNVLQLVLRQPGIRVAEPGEFTKRAFLNGRIDLTQAEAVMDLIRSKSDRAFQVAMKQSEGSLSKRIADLRQTIIEVIAHVEVNIDYPEHDVEELTSAFIREHCGVALEGVNRLLKTASEGKILREGIVTAIVGRPNVGKSSLLNALTQSNKAIVTDIPGTTRDVIEEFVTVNGIPLRLLDTAGIRETADVVERIGVERSNSALEEADLILYVLNRNEKLHDDDRQLMERLAGRQVIVIFNKTDLPQQLNSAEVEQVFPAERIVPMSVLGEEGIDRLEQVISDLFFEGRIESNDLTYVTNVRHISLLERAKQSLLDAIDATEMGVPIDIVQIDIQQAWELLGEVIGDSAGESLLDQIFSQFCLGK
ncbi:tRNA uridine-5-carboxymethylaminomethyl(34) synthesis GTPase MnmE [Paenibacillus sp. MMS18-CY102]|uniref:tRNA uridine-5-carboxymethylaminomethyl(34) synthesis GTPase MnmE n=1 Tax=Paenibacillus sp. MMS18-CY102 TaxID=2682849 RepID=UPI001365B7C1|nr:tRNA uridine-5-carboxymethylaminomethyl(34) synthesis GTPase MnmE [Paenibacillus sp. MMS18-CY102]MWC29086.1 tRNA uridine-5-carboxymethylaminomethyl(34) synthesis GTPase MnmE [Paenibacillus sp. MMS18-CY102]